VRFFRPENPACTAMFEKALFAHATDRSRTTARLSDPPEVSGWGGGVIDLSANVGHGIFAVLADEAFFRTAHIGQYGQIAWSEDIELCPDAAYEDITGKPVEAFSR
jgi:hypothetical protein